MAAPSDAEIIIASLADPSRFGAIFDRHHAEIHAYLRGRVATSDAADLAAETFCQALRVRGRFDVERADCRPWLFGIATNLLRRHWRKERRQLRAYARTGVDPLHSTTEEADDRLEAARAGPIMAAALSSLPRIQREALLLHAWAELSDLEIAEALGIAPGTVRSRLSRARRRMREQISASSEGLHEEMKATRAENGRA